MRRTVVSAPSRFGENEARRATCAGALRIATQAGCSNREVGEAADILDQGQISKLLQRLERLGLIVNDAGRRGAANAWRLTTRGEQFQVVIDGPAAGSRNGRRTYGAVCGGD